MENTSIKDRTLFLIKTLGITRTEFAKDIGSSRTSLYQWFNDVHRDYPAIINVPIAYPKVSCEWFFRGKGEVFLVQDPAYSVPEDYHNYKASEAIATASATANGTAKATANTSGRASAHSTGNASASAESTPVTLPPVEGLNRHELLSFLSHKIEETQKQLTIYNLMIQQTLNSPE